MKKLLSIVFASVLVFNFASISFAANGNATVQQSNTTVNHIINQISQFKAEVLLKDAKYKVQYFKKKDSVKILVENESGPWNLNISKEEAEQKLSAFLGKLNISKSSSNQEIIAELSKVLGIQPSDVEKVKANVRFVNGADFSLEYLKGHSKLNGENPWKIKDLNINLKAGKGEFLKVQYKDRGDAVFAYVNKKTKDGHLILHGVKALKEIQKMKEAIIPDKNKSLSEYLNNLSAVLGVTSSSITKVDFQAHFNNQTKVFAHYKQGAEKHYHHEGDSID